MNKEKIGKGIGAIIVLSLLGPLMKMAFTIDPFVNYSKDCARIQECIYSNVYSLKKHNKIYANNFNIKEGIEKYKQIINIGDKTQIFENTFNAIVYHSCNYNYESFVNLNYQEISISEIYHYANPITKVCLLNNVSKFSKSKKQVLLEYNYRFSNPITDKLREAIEEQDLVDRSYNFYKKGIFHKLVKISRGEIL